MLGRLEATGGTRLVLRGPQRGARATQLVSLAKAVQADVAQRFLSATDKSGLPPVELCLFETAKSYDAFVAALGDGPAPSELGFFSPARRLVVANVGLSIGNLRHELAHALLNDDFPDIPAWLTEGVGALYGTAKLEKAGFRFLVNYRLRHLREARAAGKLPDLAAIARSGPAEVYGEDVLAWYAVSRYLLLYLDARGTLSKCFAELRAAKSAETQLEVLRRFVEFDAFLSWSATLRLN